MAGQWVLIQKNGKKSTTPFTFSNAEVDNIARNTLKGESFTFVNAGTRRTKTIKGKKAKL